jgi:hypothetical protein
LIHDDLRIAVHPTTRVVQGFNDNKRFVIGTCESVVMNGTDSVNRYEPIAYGLRMGIGFCKSETKDDGVYDIVGEGEYDLVIEYVLEMLAVAVAVVITIAISVGVGVGVDVGDRVWSAEREGDWSDFRTRIKTGVLTGVGDGAQLYIRRYSRFPHQFS